METLKALLFLHVIMTVIAATAAAGVWLIDERLGISVAGALMIVVAALSAFAALSEMRER